MKQKFKMSLIACALTALCAGGCAKQQVVKQDQMIPPATPSAPSASTVKAPAAAVKVEARDAGLSTSKIDESQAQKQVQPATPVKAESLKTALDRIFFDFDSANLSDQAREALAKNADLLKKGQSKIQIEGHCDELGSDDYNLALGERRAKAASKYLQSLGIPSDRLSTISYGKEKPADAGHDEAARAKNRRDEFVMSN